MPPPDPEGSSRKVWLGVLIGVLVVGLLLGGGYLLSQVLKNKDQAVAFGMPSVQGLTLQQATDTLTSQYGLVVADPPTKKATDASPPQTVLGQSPASGTLVHRGDTVTLTIAVPVKQVEVPDLTCMTLADAQTALTTAHLVLGSKTTTTSDACPAGAVVHQSIAPGTKVDRNSLVNVTVASGPATITLDDYTCQTLVSAQNQLQKLGLKVVFGGTEPTLPQCPNPTRVVSQNPAGGSTVKVGDTVTLFTGETGSPTETPSP